MDNKMDVNDEEPPPSQERVRRRSVRNRSQRSQSPRRSRSLSPRRKRASPQERPRSYEKTKSLAASPDPSDLTAEKLCGIAISDLYHDFKGNEEAIETAPFSIPSKGRMCKHDDEEKILQQLLGLTRDSENHFIEPCMNKLLKPLPYEKSHCENMIRVWMILRTRLGINCNPTKSNSKLYRMRN